MWTSKNRARYDRSKLRYPSDLTDDEWELVEPLIPPGKRGGGKRTVIMREVVNGLMYVLSTGCQWRAIPKDLPPKSSVYGYFDLWTYERHVGTNSLRALSTVSRTRAAGSQSDRRHHRQPEREKRREGGRALIGGTRCECGQERYGQEAARSAVDTLGLLLHAPSFIRRRLEISDEAFSSRRHCSACFSSDDAVRRQRISRAKICERACKSSAASRH